LEPCGAGEALNFKYLTGSILSGVGWGLVACALGHSYIPGREILAGLIASPFIGFVIGVISSPAYSFPLIVHAFVPSVLLYAGAFLFAFAISGPSSEAAALPENVGGVMLGGTIYLPLLLPLAYVTHFGLGRLRKRALSDSRNSSTIHP
jgi:hypothetical protein